MRILNGLAIALCLAAAAPAGGQPSGGAQIGADSFEARKGDFAALVLLTTDTEGFLEAWAGPTPPHLPTSDEARRGEIISAMLMFAGCKPDAQGKCNLTADYLVTAPDGSSYSDSKGAPVWNEAPAPGMNLQLSVTNLSIQIEPGEALGRYGVRIRLTDHVAGATLDLATEFTALEAGQAAPAVT